ncbi:MAG: penicillin-binding transpeptidase domain-containing protein, partial [Akkermansiaceae bacterium]
STPLPTAQPASRPSSQQASPFPWLPLFALQGTLLTLLPLLISSIRLFKLSKSAPDNPPLSLWKEIHQNSRIIPPLYFTPIPAAAFACGILKPCVILPDDSPTWPPRQIRSTLVHEAEHLRRRDPLFRFLSSVVRALFWFHPLVWVAHRQLIAAQEQACDQAAINHGIAPGDYAEDLLTSLDYSQFTPAEALSMTRWSQLGNRVRHILEKPKSNTKTSLILVSVLTIATILASTSIGFSQSAVQPTPVAPSPAPPEKFKKPPAPSRGTLLDRNDTPIAINDPNGKRTYPFGKSMAHVTGYIWKKFLGGTEKSQGVIGLENTFENSLAAKKSIKTTLDAKVQQYCYEVLSKQEFPGSIVIQNPKNGAIISMTSYPAYDPNLFIPEISAENFKALQIDERQPLLDRSLGLTVPGSVVKPLVALAGEYKGLNNPEIHCKSFVQFEKIRIRDWKSDRNESFRIPGALEQSCNTYFVRLGIRAGRESLTEVGNILHLNGSPLEALYSRNSQWMTFPPGEEVDDLSLATASLGQGHTLMSPFHVSSITSAIASGFWHKPHLIFSGENSRASTALTGQGKITGESLDAIRKGMHLTIHGDRGTSKLAAIPGINLAGKTGTAQVGRGAANSWFTGYGPYEDPRYTVTVMLSGAKSGGRFAAPIAAEIFKSLLKRPQHSGE